MTKNSNICNTTKESIENIKALQNVVRKRFSNLFQDRNVKQSLLEEDFCFVLYSWGIEFDEISKVKSDLESRIILYFFVLLFGIILLIQNSYFFALLLCICAFLGISTALWRMSILTQKQFISYFRYLLSLFFIKKFIEG